LSEALLSDRGLPRMLALLVQHLEKVESEAARAKPTTPPYPRARELYHLNLESYTHWREDLVVVPPAFLAGAPGSTKPEPLYLDINVGGSLTRKTSLRIETVLHTEARAAGGPKVTWKRTLTWELLREPRPAAFAMVPRGTSENLFNDVKSELITLNPAQPPDADRAPKLGHQPSGEPSKLLKQAEAFLDFVRQTRKRVETVWLN